MAWSVNSILNLNILSFTDCGIPNRNDVNNKTFGIGLTDIAEYPWQVSMLLLDQSLQIYLNFSVSGWNNV